MWHIMAIAGGGALGALARYGVQHLVQQLWSGRFPMGILVANTLGSLLVGLLFVLLSEKGVLAASWRPFLIIGLLGAFTTFSTFSLDTIHLLGEGQWLLAIANISLNLGLGLVAVSTGIAVARVL
jgi:CrcB protein